jgi:hypothetical protein
MHFFFEFFQRLFDQGCTTPIFSLKFFKSQLIHFFFDQHQYFIDLFDQIHFFNHFPFFYFLDIHLFSDLLYFPLFVLFDLI